MEDFKKTNGEQMEQIDYVLSLTGPEDCVYDGYNRFNVFRKDLDFFWFALSSALNNYRRLTGYKYDIYKLIEQKKPKVISNITVPAQEGARKVFDVERPKISDNYLKSDRYPELYIRKD